MSRPLRALVIGGGITGLAAAHRMVELSRERGKPLELTLVEGSHRLGGTIGTDHREGFVLERGPDSFITEKPWALQLCHRLGLQDQLMSTGSTHRRSFVVKDRRLLPVPEGFQLLAPSRVWPFIASPIFSWPGKLRVALDWILPARRGGEDESLADFVLRRLGREALDRMAQPMIAGIYGADPRTLSLAATMPRFLEMEQTHGSVIRAMVARSRRPAVRQPPESRKNGEQQAVPQPSANHGVSGARYGLFVSFRAGMQTLVDTLADRLPVGSVRLRTRAFDLSRAGDQEWRVRLESESMPGGGQAVDADAVCLALPAYHTAELVGRFDPPLATQLNAIPYSSAATVNLAYRRAEVPHALDGFGFVVPSIEKRRILGCTFSSVKFPGRAPAEHALLRAFLGERSIAGKEEVDIEAVVCSELRDLLGISAAPLFALTSRHDRAMAQYTVGHLDRVKAIEAAVARHPGLALAGNAYYGIGIPDCVHSGEQAADRLMGEG
jgi:oxygen-dependent protoporphyrinogen oxidase